MQKSFIFVLILAIIIGVFALSNSEVVEIDFVFTEVMLSQAIVIFISVLLGAAVATSFGLLRQVKLQKEIKEQKKEVDKLKSENLNLIKTIDEKEEQLRLLYGRNEETGQGPSANDDFSSN